MRSGFLKRRLLEAAGGLALILAPGAAWALEAPTTAAPATAPAPTAQAATPAPAPAPTPRAAAAAVAAPRPAIWVLRDQDTTIYLFGTTHLFERGFRWRSERLNRIVAEADELVLETNDTEGDPGAMEAMFLDKPHPILDRVSPERREALAGLIARSGVPAEAWDRMQSYAAAFWLYGLVMSEVGDTQGKDQPATEMSGAEVELTEDFQRRGRPVSGVETMADQMDAFRSMPPEVQTAFLESIVDSSMVPFDESGLSGDTEWASGNLSSIEAEMAEMPPELYEALLSRRNRNWTEWLVRRMERPGTVLFAVGAGHLVGRDSLHSLLAARGLRTERID